MRTSLKYDVQREQSTDLETGKEVSKVKSRGYTFSVTGAKSEAEHISIVDSFTEFLAKNGYSSDGFGDGSWEENVRLNSTSWFLFLSIPVADMDEKEEIHALYQEWKSSFFSDGAAGRG